MEILKLLNKYGVKTKVNKMDLYKKVINSEDEFKFIKYKISNPTLFELYCLEMIITGSGLFKKTIVAYNDFINSNEELVNHLTYEQKNKFLQVDIEKIIKNDVVKIDKDEIYVPYYSREMNHMAIYDYESTMRKPYIDEFKKTSNCIELMLGYYGNQLFKTSLSCLEYLFDIGEGSYFYDQSVGCVLKLDVTGTMCDLYYIFDKQISVYPPTDIVKKVLSTEDSKKLLNDLLNHKMVCKKVYKKLCKKMKVK